MFAAMSATVEIAMANMAWLSIRVTSATSHVLIVQLMHAEAAMQTRYILYNKSINNNNNNTQCLNGELNKLEACYLLNSNFS